MSSIQLNKHSLIIFTLLTTFLLFQTNLPNNDLWSTIIQKKYRRSVYGKAYNPDPYLFNTLPNKTVSMKLTKSQLSKHPSITITQGTMMDVTPDRESFMHKIMWYNASGQAITNTWTTYQYDTSIPVPKGATSFIVAGTDYYYPLNGSGYLHVDLPPTGYSANYTLSVTPKWFWSNHSKLVDTMQITRNN